LNQARGSWELGSGSVFLAGNANPEIACIPPDGARTLDNECPQGWRRAHAAINLTASWRCAAFQFRQVGVDETRLLFARPETRGITAGSASRERSHCITSTPGCAQEQKQTQLHAAMVITPVWVCVSAVGPHGSVDNPRHFSPSSQHRISLVTQKRQGYRHISSVSVVDIRTARTAGAHGSSMTTNRKHCCQEPRPKLGHGGSWVWPPVCIPAASASRMSSPANDGCFNG
jgi:hypothetical protein